MIIECHKLYFLELLDFVLQFLQMSNAYLETKDTVSFQGAVWFIAIRHILLCSSFYKIIFMHLCGGGAPPAEHCPPPSTMHEDKSTKT